MEHKLRRGTRGIGPRRLVREGLELSSPPRPQNYFQKLEKLSAAEEVHGDGPKKERTKLITPQVARLEHTYKPGTTLLPPGSPARGQPQAGGRHGAAARGEVGS